MSGVGRRGVACAGEAGETGEGLGADVVGAGVEDPVGFAHCVLVWFCGCGGLWRGLGW